jgi:hypothetical protein
MVPVLMALPARSCGPDFPDAVFVKDNGPDLPYATFAGGRLGVLQSGYRTRHLVVAYDWLTQRPLTPPEQKQAGAVDALFLSNGISVLSPDAAKQGFTSWIKARANFGPVDNYLPDDKLDTEHQVVADGYDTFTNCLDDAFANAAKTLAARVQAHGSAQDPAVVEWVRGQDDVFTNCAGAKHNPYPEPNQPPPTPPRQPKVLANAAAWLHQDRDYQIAASHFYAMDFDAAITGFRAIAADKASPWSPVARYVVARAMIRRATLAYAQASDAQNSGPNATDQAHTQLLAGFNEAKKELLAMRAEPRMASMQRQIDDLLDLVNARVDPAQQALVLAGRLHGHDGSAFDQNLIDLTYIRTHDTSDTKTAPATSKGNATDMIGWIDTVSGSDETTALQQWHATKKNLWLLAAMMSTKPGDAAVSELVRAATSVPANDPAYVGISYHRLRLMPRDATTREQLLAILPRIDKQEGPSAINLFAELNAATAPSLDTWLSAAGRQLADEDSIFGDGQVDTTRKEDVCGKKIAPGSTELFDVDAAVALNRNMPLRLLAVAAESSALPENLRFQVAQATWARAVLLDQPEIAHRMTPLLISCRAAWKPVLTDYDNAKTATDRKATGLLALLRFASTEPSVRQGEERRSGFATYDDFRQNWWCSTVPVPGGSIDIPDIPQPKSPPMPPPPTFLTAQDRDEAQHEVAALQKIPGASTYFATEALTWLKEHPKDPRTADIMGEANRALRNTCRDDKTTPPLAHQLFDAIHKNFPQSTWASKYPTWE